MRFVGWHSYRAAAVADEPDVPRVGEPLPNADAANIDKAKLVSYGLDPDHPVGTHKATVFARALGIEIDQWAYLRDRILEELPRHPVSGSRPPRSEHEVFTWEVLLIPVNGLGAQAGRALKVITAWEIVHGRPDLVTLRVAPENRQDPTSSG